MDAITAETIDQGGHSYRITVYPDGDSLNPLAEGCEMGTLLSRNRWHRNFDPEGVAAALADNPDAVPLSYYEHGRCLWSVAGELPAGCRCPFDAVALAGVWLPDAATLASAARYGGRTRWHFLRKRARQACHAYTTWCNGEIYGFRVERFITCTACEQEHATEVASCWGFYELEDCLADARAAIP